jgi:uncharacterized damage-inducible protein DinB
METQQLLEQYAGGVKILRQAVAGMSQEQLLARPIAGKWSTLEVVCHLADFEPIYADRMKRLLAEDRPVYISADQDAFARALAYTDRDAEEEIALMDKVRQQMVRILRKQPAAAFNRVGLYRHEAKDEPRTLEQLLTIITNHIPHHSKFIMEKRRALGLA